MLGADGELKALCQKRSPPEIQMALKMLRDG